MNLIDTNIIIRYLVDDSDKYHGVSALFSRLKSGEEKIECTLVIFFQTIFMLKSFYPDKKNTTSLDVDEFQNSSQYRDVAHRA